MKKNNLNEGIVSRFIDAFFDSYKRGVDKQFIQKSREQNPELAKTLEKVSKDLGDLHKMLANNK
jgi:hypothetical protein